MKYLFLICTLVLSISTPCRAMSQESESEYDEEVHLWRIIDPDFSVSNQQKPLRFGPIDTPLVITKSARKKIRKFMANPDPEHWYHHAQFKKNRTLVVKAIRQGRDPRHFLEGIMTWQDYYLLREAIEHGCNANEEYGLFGKPLIFGARSLLMAQYLVEQGADRTEVCEPWGTVLHAACYSDYSPAVLEYHIESDQIPINSTEGSSGAPIHDWAKHSYVLDKHAVAIKKLHLLLHAGANTALRNTHGFTPLGILRSAKRKYTLNPGAWAHKIEGYNQLISPILDILKRGVKRKRDQLDTQPTCAICTEDFTNKKEKKLRFMCDHTFHSDCVQQWLKTSQQQNCPICRAEYKGL